MWRRIRTRDSGELLATPVIRAMRATDLSEVLEIEKHIYEFPWPRRAFEDCLRLGYYCVLVCERARPRKEVVCGYGIMEVAKDQAHICNVSVAEDRQRQGIGRFLMEALLTRAKNKGTKSAYLEVRPSNYGAQDFYRKLGFNYASTRRDYYRAKVGVEDALVFRIEFAA